MRFYHRNYSLFPCFSANINHFIHIHTEKLFWWCKCSILLTSHMFPNSLLFFFFELTLFSLLFSYCSFTFLKFSFIFSYLFFSPKVVTNFSWVISMSISAWDTRVSMLSSLLLANKRILSWVSFLFLVILSIFFIIPVLKKKLK